MHTGDFRDDLIKSPFDYKPVSKGISGTRFFRRSETVSNTSTHRREGRK